MILITDLFTSETDQIILPSDCLQVTDLISNTCSNYGDSDRIPNSGGFNHRFLKLRKNTEHFILNINELKNPKANSKAKSKGFFFKFNQILVRDFFKIP